MNPFTDYISSWYGYPSSMSYSLPHPAPHDLMGLSSTSSSSSYSSGNSPQPIVDSTIQGNPRYQTPHIPMSLVSMNFQGINFPIPCINAYQNGMIGLSPYDSAVVPNLHVTTAPVKHNPTNEVSTLKATPMPQETKIHFRTRFTAEQLKKLEAEFKINSCLDSKRKKKLVEEIGLAPRVVSVWFKNRRTRNKKQDNGTR